MADAGGPAALGARRGDGAGRWIPGGAGAASAAGVAAMVAGGGIAGAAAVALGLLGVVGLTLRRRRREPAALLLATAAWAASGLVPGLAHLAPAPILVGLAAYALAAGRPGWLARGALGWRELAWVLGIAAASGVALVGWWRLSRPDLSDLTLAAELRARVATPAVLAAAILGWSCLNALAEELFFRGALQAALGEALGPALGALGQAAVFGLAHLHGFPRGAAGVGLAATYGLMLGALRVRAHGLAAPWAAHVAADVVISCVLLGQVR